MKADEYYHAIRSMIVHEDSLLASRTNWLLITQGLLFTAFGVLKSNVQITWVLAVVGIIVSISFFISFQISEKAIRFLRDTWEKYPRRSRRVIYPPVIGIPPMELFLLLDRYISPRKILPWVFALAWIVICVLNTVLK